VHSLKVDKDDEEPRHAEDQDMSKDVVVDGNNRRWRIHTFFLFSWDGRIDSCLVSLAVQQAFS
jgi:hypothetical protein